MQDVFEDRVATITFFFFEEGDSSFDSPHLLAKTISLFPTLTETSPITKKAIKTAATGTGIKAPILGIEALSRNLKRSDRTC